MVELQEARDQLLEERKAACLRDFDSGVSREAICRTHDISYAALSSILHKNKRTAKSRIVSAVPKSLPSGGISRRTDREKLYDAKAGTRMIAVAVTEGANA